MGKGDAGSRQMGSRASSAPAGSSAPTLVAAVAAGRCTHFGSARSETRYQGRDRAVVRARTCNNEQRDSQEQQTTHPGDGRSPCPLPQLVLCANCSTNSHPHSVVIITELMTRDYYTCAPTAASPGLVERPIGEAALELLPADKRSSTRQSLAIAHGQLRARPR